MKLLILALLMSGCGKANSEPSRAPAIEEPIERACDKLTIMLDETVLGFIKKVRVNKHVICYVFFDEDGGNTMDCVKKENEHEK